MQHPDEGEELACRVTATNRVGKLAVATRAVTVAIAPSVRVPPHVSGTPKVGEELECDPGEWSGSPPPTVQLEWLVGGTAVPGQTHSRYTIQRGDEGATVTCRVTASNEAGKSAVVSAGKTVFSLPTRETELEIGGVVAVGQTVECPRGIWSGTTPMKFATEWRLDGGQVQGEVQASYQIPSSEAGHVLQCAVSASNDAGFRQVVSVGVTVRAAPVATSAPEVSGIAKVGQALSCLSGSWAGATPMTFTYQWLRAGTPIANETEPQHLVTRADEGTALACTVTAKNAAGSGHETSAAVDVPKLPQATRAPAAAGGIKLGEKLTCDEGAWSGTAPITYTFQWFRGETGLPSETHREHEIVSADEGKLLSCVVTATNAAGSESARSNSVAVAELPENRKRPSISGTITLGSLLTCDEGTWVGTAPLAFRFQWMRDDEPIAGATETRYQVAGVDEGHDISCAVTATNAAGPVTAVSLAREVPDEAKKQKEAELITSFDNTRGDVAPYVAPFDHVAQRFVAKADTIVYAGVTIANPALPVGPTSDVVTVKICTTVKCTFAAETEAEAHATVNNYGLTRVVFHEEAELDVGRSYFLVWSAPANTHNSQWLAFWHHGTAELGSGEFEAVIRGYNFGDSGGERKVISYSAAQAPPAPYTGSFSEAIQEFTAASNEITELGVVIGDPAVPNGQKGPQMVTMRLCATSTCAGGPLASVEASVANYQVTRGKLKSPVAVTIGQKYYLTWQAPSPVGGEPWVTFWEGTSATLDGASAFQAVVTGYDEGAAKYQPPVFHEQANATLTPYGGYEDGSKPGATLKSGEEVEVSCRVFAPALETAEPEGFWYRLHAGSWNDEYYAPTNAFRNGAKVGETISTDRRVPFC